MKISWEALACSVWRGKSVLEVYGLCSFRKNLDLHLRWWSLCVILRTVIISNDFGHWSTICYAQSQKMIEYWIVSVFWEWVHVTGSVLLSLGAAGHRGCWVAGKGYSASTRWANKASVLVWTRPCPYVNIADIREHPKRTRASVCIRKCAYSSLRTTLGVHLGTALALQWKTADTWSLAGWLCTARKNIKRTLNLF